jgi:hypothetical protein
MSEKEDEGYLWLGWIKLAQEYDVEECSIYRETQASSTWLE